MTINQQAIEQSIKPWLNAQRIGIAAYAVMRMPQVLHVSSRYGNKAQEHEEFFRIFENIQLTLETSLRIHLYERNGTSQATEAEQRSEPSLRKALCNNLSQLPLSALHLLDNVLTKKPNHVSKFVRNLRDPVKDALVLLYESHPAMLGNAQTIAYHIIDSVASARTIVRLGESRWDGHRRQNPWSRLLENQARLEQLEHFLRVLRVAHADTLSTLSNICELGSILKSTPSWCHVENILISQSLAWPLLVPTYEQTDLGISLPVAIDITFDGMRDICIEKTHSENNHHGGIDASKWQEHLQQSVDVAKILWLSKHGNHGVYERWRDCPDDFRWKVNHASVSFDFYWANRILGDIPASFRDGSADTCFAMSVLARLLGKRGYLSSVVTGLIGERCRDNGTRQEELDFWVKPPDGIVPKLRYFFAAGTFERAALPKGAEKDIKTILKDLALRGTKIIRNAEIAYGAKLSHIADIVQVRGWRQQRFIRCPEIQWATQEEYDGKRSRLLKLEDSRVQHVIELLRENPSPVLDLKEDQELTPCAVAAGLWHINMNLRRLQMPRIPPMFSSLFIRATPDQHDSRFWEIIWRAIGAPITVFDELNHVPSPAKAAVVLAGALNTFHPLESSPGYRAPDILVIIGPERFVENLESTATPTARNLAVMPILDELTRQGLLRISPNAKTLAPLLGRTRILLVPDRPDQESTRSTLHVALQELDLTERIALTALSTFRYGFTHSMAAVLLSLTGVIDHKSQHSVRDYLLRLRDKGLIRYAQGWYHLPFSLHDKLDTALQSHPSDVNAPPRVNMAQYHLAAGTALAPYVLDSPVMALAFDRAFLPENVYEALFHFNEACSMQRARGWQSTARSRKLQLLRFSAFPTWATTANLRQSGNVRALIDAYEMGKDLVESWEKKNVEFLHPEHYLNVAKCAVSLSKTDTSADIKRRLRTELTGPEGLFEKALKACEALPDGDEKDFTRPYVRSTYANYLFELGPEHKEHARGFDREILQFLHSNSDVNARGIQGEWFERVGDETTTHSEAMHIYKLGLRYVPEWHQLWVKALGAARLALDSPAWIRDVLAHYAAQKSLTTEEAMAHIVWQADSRWDKSAHSWVQERWNAGKIY